MRLRKSQRGMSMFNLMYVLVTLAIFGYIGLKLMPMYLDGFKVDKAVNAVAAVPGAKGKAPKELIGLILKRLSIDNVKVINGRNWRESITFKKTKRKLIITADYRSDVPLFGNLSVSAAFSYKGESP
jgi:hypothetical protein